MPTASDGLDRRHAIHYAVTEVLARAESLSAATPAVLQALCRTMAWDLGAVWRVDEQAGVLRCVDLWRLDESIGSEFARVSRSRTFVSGIGLPGRVWELGRATWIPDVVVDDNFPRAPIALREGLHGALAFPIFLGDRVLGVIEFFSRQIREPDDDLVDMMGAIGGQLGQFIARREAEEASLASEARIRAILESALDCIVSVDADGRILEFNPAAERTFGHPREGVLGRPIAEILIPHHLRDRHHRAFDRYLSTGRATVLGRRMEFEGLRADGTVFPVELAVTRVPLPGPPGFTAYLRDITDRRRAEDEREGLLAAERRARVEVEEAFETLQRSLLPPALPEIPGVELGSFHRAAGPGSLVGGDFYDVFQTGPEHWGLAIGDVCGRGTKAAALTALSRYTLRAAAIRTSKPKAVLAILNEAVLREDLHAQFCTAVYARLRSSGGGPSLTMAVGGHPPPLILRSNGTVERLPETGTLLGALPNPALTDQRVALGPGETLLLYTDGVIETRTKDGFLEIEGLERILPTCRGLEAATLIARLGRHVDTLRQGPARDDMALLAVRASGPQA